MPAEPASQETIALVSCAKKKQRIPCRAEELYVSPLFKKSRVYAKQNADRWFILSAKYGLVDPCDRLEPYEQTLKDLPRSERRAWGVRVAEQMRQQGILRPGVTILWLAGRAYQEPLSSALVGFSQDDPLAGLRFGPRLAWLKRHNPPS